MKICYVISTVNIAGGANRSLLDLLPYVIDAGHECTILACAHGSMEDAARDLGIPYKVIPFSTYVETTTLYRKLRRRAANIYGKYAIGRFLRHERFDLVHNNSLPTAVGMDAALAVDIPYVCHIRENVWNGLGMQFYCPNRVRKILQGAAKVITISEYIARSYVDFAPDVDYLIMNDGLCVDDYVSKRDIFTGDTIRMGIVGIINPQKGQREAVEALEILHQRGFSNIELDIIGDDGLWNGSRGYAQDLKRYVAEKEIRSVQFIPAIEDAGKLKERRDSYDINLICSSAEGLGRTTIESMLSDSLTIAANAGATPEIINDNEYGLLYESGNAEDLADKIEYAIQNRELMKAIAKRGQAYAIDRFSIQAYSSSILKVYDSALRERNKSGCK